MNQMQTNAGGPSAGEKKMTASAKMMVRVAVMAVLVTSCAVVLTSFPQAVLGAGKTVPPAVTAVDPGVRQGAAGAGGFLKGMTADQIAILPQLTQEMSQVYNVPADGIGSDGTYGGLGPRFNSNSCASCHAFPAVGGSSPASNPLFGVYKLLGATNTMPSFITTTGPVLEARFLTNSDGTTDGNVHQLFTIKGRTDSGGCGLAQPDFATAIAKGNIAYRQPIPTFGDGEIEIIQNSDIIANQNANLTVKQGLGITGHPNFSGNDGSIMRFGWKAQIRSVHIFAAQQYNVEMGVTNETFQNEVDDSDLTCLTNPSPESGTNFAPGIPYMNFPGGPERAAEYITFLAGPTPATPTSSTRNGETQFNNIGCVYCHTKQWSTPASSLGGNITGQKRINIYSDLLVHHMGPNLADGLTQGGAGPDEFRTAPLWGIGQRYFFMHDGRTSDIVQAIEAHYSLANGTYPASEANQTVTNFNNLSSTNQQDLINFLRSL